MTFRAKTAVAVVFICLAVWVLTAQASAQVENGCTFFGAAKLDGADVAGGILITATIEGDEYYTHTAYGSSSYRITIAAPEGKNYPDGAKVVFKIDNHSAGQTATFQAGTNQQLDLTASSRPAPDYSSMWLITVTVLAVLVLGAAAYLLLTRRLRPQMVIPKAILTRIYPRMGREEIEGAPAEQQEQIWFRYVWDNSKMAWVEHAEGAEGTPEIPPPEEMGSSTEAPDASAVMSPPLTQNISQELRESEEGTAAMQDLGATTEELEHGQEKVVFPNEIVELVMPLSLHSEASRKIIKHLIDLKKSREIKIIDLRNMRGQGMRITLLLKYHSALLSVLNILNEVPEATLLPSKSEDVRKE